MKFFDKSKGMQDYLNTQSMNFFGVKTSDCLKDSVCVICHCAVVKENLVPIDLDEYEMSGVCPNCFNGLFWKDE